MNRRAFMGTAALLNTPALLKGVFAREKKPNILLAISDDQSWAHTGFGGDSVIQTPGFDRVAREGAYFSHAFCSSPSCAPSRAAVLTGQDFWRLESGANLYGELPERHPAYPLVLEREGYAIGHTGKGRFSLRSPHPCGPAYNQHESSPPAGGIRPIDYTANFREFLSRRDRDQPFCFWYGGWEPHRPYQPGKASRSKRRWENLTVPPFLPDTPAVRDELYDYGREIEWFDRHLVQMLNQLEQTGELDNTIVAVTSDNGMPFPRAKATLYDYGARVPLAIRWPEGIAGGQVVSDFVNLTDLAPTFLAASGREIPVEMTGRNLLPALNSKGGRELLRESIVTGRERHGYNREPNVGYPMRAIRTADFLYIRNFKPDRWPMVDHNLPAAASQALLDFGSDPEVRRLYCLAFAPRPAEELYDLRKDPLQMANVAHREEYRDTRNQLVRDLDQYLHRTGDPRVLGNGDIFDTYSYHASSTGNHRRFQQFLAEKDPPRCK